MTSERSEFKIKSFLFHVTESSVFEADSAAAFDSVDYIFITEGSKTFDFSETFIKWVRIFHTNIESCIINNGIFSFTVEQDKEILLPLLYLY